MTAVDNYLFLREKLKSWNRLWGDVEKKPNIWNKYSPTQANQPPCVFSYFNLKAVNVIQPPQQLPMTFIHPPTIFSSFVDLLSSGEIRLIHLGLCSISGGWQCHRKINNPMAYFCYYPSCYCFMVQPCPCASTRIHQIIVFCFASP